MVALNQVLGMFVYYTKWIIYFSGYAQPLIRVNHFSVESEHFEATIHQYCIAMHCLHSSKPYVIECDTSDVDILATLNQSGQPVAFMS